ncbi:hypothetical protein SMC26_05400 [Actinomadura fulvescens]|uniref:Secreted protein n=1 Tax=Actinomadura fulvescens TaxID=46160 RepID=A0ABN3Q933_9ACTN
MASHLKRGITAVAVAALTGGLVAVPATPASAKVYYSKRVVRYDGVTGRLDIDHRGKGKFYARGRFHNSKKYNADFRVTIERRKGKGAWRQVGAAGWLENTRPKHTTRWVWDGKGYQARLCIAVYDGNGYHGRRCSAAY